MRMMHFRLAEEDHELHIYIDTLKPIINGGGVQQVPKSMSEVSK